MSVLREGPSREVPTKVSGGQKVVMLYQILYPHYKYSLMMLKLSVGSLLQSEAFDDFVKPAR